MADYIVDGTELTSVANAIRTKGGTNSPLAFPNGFVSAVNNISGGGSSDFSTAEVTFVTDNIPEINLDIINVQNDGLYSEVLINQQEQTVTVPLYQNKLSFYLSLFNMSVSSTTGNITGSQNDGFIVTGDCVINYEVPL